MNRTDYKPPEVAPILVDSKTAARACGIGVSLWNSLSSAGRTPQPVKLNSKNLWSYSLLQLWAESGCKSRTSPEWLQLLEKMRGGDHV